MNHKIFTYLNLSHLKRNKQKNYKIFYYLLVFKKMVTAFLKPLLSTKERSPCNSGCFWLHSYITEKDFFFSFQVAVYKVQKSDERILAPIVIFRN